MKKNIFLLFLLFIIGIGTTKAQYDTLFNFKGANGADPNGSLTLSGSKLYGMTTNGGAQNYGCIFSIDTNGTNYKLLYSFNSLTGAYPYGSLTQVGNKLYGMTSQGGAYGGGNVFSIDTDGTNISNLRSFNGSSLGSHPFGSLTFSEGKLYGMTEYGGVKGDGNIFSVDTNGTNFTNLFSFNVTNGNNPMGSLIIVGNRLFGMTQSGGANDSGVVFSIDTLGNGYKDLFDCTRKKGFDPGGSLLFFGNKLYGMTSLGGVNDDGVIFSIDTDGSNETLLSSFSGTNGKWPSVYSSLSVSGSTLYGMTYQGGLGPGVIFSLDTSGANYKYLYAFSPASGSDPNGSLTLVGNKLFGMTNYGGIGGDGGIFDFHISTCTNMFDEPICLLTVDTATGWCKIIWGKTNSPTNATNSYYNIYRNTGAGYKLLHPQALDSLTEYIDTTFNPSSGNASYKLSTVDSCGESALSAPNTSILLTTSAGVNVYILNWTAYGGFTPSEYHIFRGSSIHSLILLDSVPSTVLTYHDTLPPPGSVYMVEAVNPSGSCIPTHRAYKGSSMLSGSFSNGFNTAVLTMVKPVNSMTNSASLYPNPANQILNIKFSNAHSVVAISISDITGRVIMNVENGISSNNVIPINVSSLQAGIYFVQIISKTSIQVVKFIKE